MVNIEDFPPERRAKIKDAIERVMGILQEECESGEQAEAVMRICQGVLLEKLVDAEHWDRKTLLEMYARVEAERLKGKW